MKRILTGIGAIVFTIALTGMEMAAGQTATQPQDQTQVQIHSAEQLQLMEKTGALDKNAIEAMRKQHYGDGEIVIAGALAKASNHPLSRITALRKQGMGWGEIAQKYNLKLGDVMKSVHANINAYENEAKHKQDKNGISAANQLDKDIQHQEKMDMKNMMQHRNEQMQHEMNMEGHHEGGMNSPMNEQHGNSPDMNGMHGK